MTYSTKEITQANQEGYQAFYNAYIHSNFDTIIEARCSCQYVQGSQEYKDWHAGFDEAEYEISIP